MNYFKIVFLAITIVCHTTLANEHFNEVSSSEYKLILSPDRFNLEHEQSGVADFADDLKATIVKAIDREVTGKMKLEEERLVSFFDTPDSCELRRRGYVFRERLSKDKSKVTLKFRSSDKDRTAGENLASKNDDNKIKLEADIGIDGNNELKVIYSQSNTIKSKREINQLKDINKQFPGFKNKHELNNDLPLQRVRDLIISERVYEGMELDLGKTDASFSITFWYKEEGLKSQTPLIAEVSFKYDEDFETFDSTVAKRAESVLRSMQTMENWVARESDTKTNFVYNYAGGFCK